MKKAILLLFLISISTVNAQKYELGKVSIEELKEKVCPIDTSAVAAVLFSVGKTHFEYSGDSGFSIITEINTKIKIYKKEGYEYANKSIKYYLGSRGNEVVDISKAATYNILDGKIEKSKLKSDGEFDEKVNKFWSRKKITLPNVKEGSIIEYSILIKSPYFSNFPDWSFQTDIPVMYSEYATYIPEYYIYNTHFKGHLTPLITNNGKSRSIDYTYTEDVVPGFGQSMPKRVSSTLNFQESIVKYTLEKIPALKDESFVNNIDNYTASVSHEISGTRFPNSPYKNFATDWETVTKQIYDNEDFGSELNKSGYFEKDIDALLNGITSTEERIATIFNYVKSKMNWDEYYGFTCINGVKKAYQDKKGNVAEINLMLTAMLRYTGVNANPILVSTRNNGISLFPSQSAYNYVISGIEVENNVILMDATNKFSLPDVLPTRDLNWIGRIIRKNGSSALIDLMPKKNALDVINIMASIKNDGEVTGKVRDQYFDYNAFLFRDNYGSLSKESLLEKKEKRYTGLEVSEYDVQNLNDLSKPIIENYSFTNNNVIEIIGDKMYFSPFLHFSMTENPFKQEKREYPVDFVFPRQDKFNISITIPDGYVVETLPQSASVSMPDGIGSFKYNISNNGNQVQLLYVIDNNQAIIGAEYYETLKSYYKEVISKQTEKIVLKKI